MHCRRVAALGRCVGVVVWVSTPMMRAAVCLPYVLAVRHCRAAVLHVRPFQHSLGVCICCVVFVVAVVVVVVVGLLVARVLHCRRRVVTRATVAVSLVCRVG